MQITAAGGDGEGWSRGGVLGAARCAVDAARGLVDSMLHGQHGTVCRGHAGHCVIQGRWHVAGTAAGTREQVDAHAWVHY